MDKLYEYQGTVEHQKPLGREVSEFMNNCDFSGKWAVVTDNISFKSSTNKPLAEFENTIKQAYEKAGGKVFKVTIWKRPADLLDTRGRK
jgi:hypothetical protein